jgi:hypothetical protein
MTRGTFKSLRPIALSAIYLAFLGACSDEPDELQDNSNPTVTDVAVPDLGGFWRHNVSHFSEPGSGPGPVTNFPGKPFLYRQDRARGLTGISVWVGDYTNPILQPWAAEAVKAHGDEGLATGEALPELLQFCLQVGVPHILLLRDAVTFLQEPDMVTIAYQRDQQVRRVYLNAEHPDHWDATPYGHSIGWYEGDTLVVDTVGMTNVGPIDYYGTPHTDALHVIEHYRVIDGGENLEVEFTVDDPGAFTMPWNAVQRYARSPQADFGEIRCSENPRDIFGGEDPIPMDLTPDF